jgi:hypothetical protein
METLDDSKISELPKWFLQTPVGQNMIAEREKEKTNVRRRVVQELAEVEAASVAKISATDKELKDAESALAKAREILRQAETRLFKVNTLRSGINNATDRERQRLQRALTETLPPEVSEIEAVWEKEIQQLRVTEPQIEKVYGGMMNKYLQKVLSNRPGLMNRISALQAARGELMNALALTCVTGAEVKKAAEALYAAIPPIGEPVEIDHTGEPVN